MNYDESNLNASDIFIKMNKPARLKALQVILDSCEVMRLGFDIVDNEKFRDYFKKLPKSKRDKFFERHYYYSDDIYEFVDIVYCGLNPETEECTGKTTYERKALWLDLFPLFPKRVQLQFLEDNEAFYAKTLAIKNNTYDWSNFECTDRDRFPLVSNMWCELGTQIYDCRQANGRLCPCLRESSTTSAWKCFRPHLQKSGLPPTGHIPLDKLSE